MITMDGEQMRIVLHFVEIVVSKYVIYDKNITSYLSDKCMQQCNTISYNRCRAVIVM